MNVSGSTTLRATVGNLITIQLTAFDAEDGNIQVMNVSALPAGATLNGSTGVLAWTPSNLNRVEFRLVARVFNGGISYIYFVNDSPAMYVNNVKL